MKMQFVLILLMFCSLVIKLTGQNSTPKSKYKIDLVLIGKVDLIRGDLIELKDSTIIFRNDNRREVLQEVRISDIQYIKVARKKNLGKGILIGAATGLVVGGLIGSAIPNRNSTTIPGQIDKSSNSAGAITLCTILGTVIGAIAGSAKKTLPIYGNMYWYQKYKQNLDKYSVPYFTIPSSKTN